MKSLMEQVCIFLVIIIYVYHNTWLKKCKVSYIIWFFT